MSGHPSSSELSMQSVTLSHLLSISRHSPEVHANLLLGHWSGTLAVRGEWLINMRQKHKAGVNSGENGREPAHSTQKNKKREIQTLFKATDMLQRKAMV